MRLLNLKHIIILLFDSNLIRSAIFFFAIYIVISYFNGDFDSDYNEYNSEIVETYLDFSYESTWSDGEGKTWVYHYRYLVDTAKFEGKSRGPANMFKNGDRISVQYKISKPEKSRIVDLYVKDNSLSEAPWATISIVYYFAIIQAFIGLLVLLFRLRLIIYGVPVRARYDNHLYLWPIRYERDSTVFKLTLTYTIEYQNTIKKNFFFASTKNLDNLLDFELLIDPINPKIALISNNLPKSIKKLIVYD